MAWSETFAPGDSPAMWTAGDFVEENKLDQMLANDRYLRENMDFRVIGSITIPRIVVTTQGGTVGATWTGTLSVGGTTIWGSSTLSVNSAGGPHIVSNTDVPVTLNNGLNWVAVNTDNRCAFVSTQESGFVSTWGSMNYENKTWDTIGGSTTYTVNFSVQLTVIAHRVAQGW